MAGTITYTIAGGQAPYTVELNPYSSVTQTTAGTFSFPNVPDGEYTLTVIDSNNCEFEKVLVVSPTAPTTTTTTAPPPSSLIVGNTNETSLIFINNTTNRNSHYTTSDGQVATLYLWFRTTNGAPLTTTEVIDYSFETDNSELQFIALSDEIHAEIAELIDGPAELISGQIVLKPGFIETFVNYTFTQDGSEQEFEINLQSTGNIFNITPNTIDEDGRIYGINILEVDNIIMSF